MNKLNKALVGTATAAAMAVSATPAMADHGRSHGPSTGEIIAGVAIVGAIAAIASSGNNDRRYNDGNYRDGNYRDGNYRGDRYDNGRYGDSRYGNNYRHINQRQAVNLCTRAAQQGATNYGRARVTDIRDIDRTRYGYRVKGRILVEQGRNRYQRSGYGDQGNFTCYIEGNRVSDVRYSGLRYTRR